LFVASLMRIQFDLTLFSLFSSLFSFYHSFQTTLQLPIKSHSN
jgi:hypothetical protein